MRQTSLAITRTLCKLLWLSRISRANCYVVLC